MFSLVEFEFVCIIGNVGCSVEVRSYKFCELCLEVVPDRGGDSVETEHEFNAFGDHAVRYRLEGTGNVFRKYNRNVFPFSAFWAVQAVVEIEFPVSPTM